MVHRVPLSRDVSKLDGLKNKHIILEIFLLSFVSGIKP